MLTGIEQGFWAYFSKAFPSTLPVFMTQEVSSGPRSAVFLGPSLLAE